MSETLPTVAVSAQRCGWVLMSSYKEVLNMKNQLIDLNNHLFMQLERLGDEDLAQEQLEKEVERAKAMNQVAGKIIDNARLALDAEKLRLEHVDGRANLPAMIEAKHG